MSKINGAEALIEALKSEDVKHIFGIPGGAIIDVYDVLYDETEIDHILTRHEQGAVHAADGYARASGKPGVCMATSGPGATNLTTGMANALMDSSPIIAITGQVPKHMLGTDAFQEADILSVMMPVTKHNLMLRDPIEIPEKVNLSFKIATTGRPGPVHIDFPKDVQQAEGDIEVPMEVDYVGKECVKPKREEVQKAFEVLNEANRPLILAGGGVIISQACPELEKLADKMQIPVAMTMMGLGVISDDHPLSLGMIGMHGRMAANIAITECDALLAIGVRFDDRATGDIRYFAPKADIIHVDIDSVELGKNIRVNVPIESNAKDALKDILKMINSSVKIKKSSQWVRRVKALRKKFSPKMDYNDIPIKPQRVIKEIMDVADKDAIITAEVGQCEMWAAHYYSVKKPRTWIASGGLGTMGFGFPAAIGAKVAKPDTQVMDIAGDGSFLMNSQELATAVERDIPVIICILNNRYLGMVKQWQDLFYDERRSSTDLGGSPDFTELAEAYGAYGAQITDPDDIAPRMEEALKSGKPAVLDIVIDPNEQCLPMVPAGGRLDKMLT